MVKAKKGEEMVATARMVKVKEVEAKKGVEKGSVRSNA